jgi:hypothetical protein
MYPCWPELASPDWPWWPSSHPQVHPECWDHRHAPPHVFSTFFFFFYNQCVFFCSKKRRLLCLCFTVLKPHSIAGSAQYSKTPDSACLVLILDLSWLEWLQISDLAWSMMILDSLSPLRLCK